MRTKSSVWAAGLLAGLCMLSSLAESSAMGQVFAVRVDEPPPLGVAASVPGPRPERGAIIEVGVDELGRLFRSAPVFDPSAEFKVYGLPLAIPGPDGRPIECVVARSAIMEPELAARFPEMVTLVLATVDGRGSGRIELTPRGLSAMVRFAGETGGAWMIDAWRSADPAHAVSYWLHDLPGGQDWTCHTAAGGVGGEGGPAAGPAPYEPRAYQTVRRFRLAMACTGEFGAYHSQIQNRPPNVSDPLAAIVTIVSRTNVVYEGDLAIHFDLVGNNDRIVYFDPVTDPYPSSCSGTGGSDCSGSYLGPNESTLRSQIGDANFDIGHLVTRVSGGVAYLRVVCGPAKAGGISGIPRGGDIDPFAANVVIHEIGHQFGANHTFSGTLGRCAGNRNLSTAWEAGSGSSPMAYAGACPVGDGVPSDNVARFADPFFHHGTIAEIRTFLPLATCAEQYVSENNIPVILSTPANMAIPPSTPFALTARAVDEDEDALTYSWEQADAGIARPLVGGVDNGIGALFRIFPPTTSPTRTFPRMEDVLSGIPTPGERFPTAVGRNRTFRVIVRDNRPGVGASVASGLVTLTIAEGTTAFAALTPRQDQLVFGGPLNVTWSVGNTNAAPVSCASVEIALSLDDGASFPVSLGTFPNNGAATVVVPETTARARLRISAVGNVFFAVSRPFTLASSCAADLDDGSGLGVRDGGVGIDDLLYFLSLYAAGDARADLDDGSGSGTRDGAVDMQDLGYFAERLTEGC